MVMHTCKSQLRGKPRQEDSRSSQSPCLPREFRTSLDYTETLPSKLKRQVRKENSKKLAKRGFPIPLEAEAKSGSDHLQGQHSRSCGRGILLQPAQAAKQDLLQNNTDFLFQSSERCSEVVRR